MARIIRDQAVASTALDRHGEQLTEDELRHLYSQIPSERLLSVNHDLTQPPAARAYNTRLEQRDDVLAVVCDIEVLDEQALEDAQVTGFSISYHRSLPIADPGGESAIISFNARSIDRQLIDDAVRSAGLDHSKVVIGERSDKSLAAALAIIYVISSGFWNEAGADLYRLWKELARRAIELNKPTKVVLRAPPAPDNPEIIVTPDPATEVSALRQIDVPALVEQARALAQDGALTKVVIEVDADGNARIEFAVDARGASLADQRSM